MLPEYYRFRVRNSTDQTITYNNGGRLSVNIVPWKMTSGAKVVGSEIVDDMDLGSGGSIAPNAEKEGDIQDNTTAQNIGFTGTFSAVADANSTDGTLDLYMEGSNDGTTWPSDLADFDITDLQLIGKLTLSTDAEDEGRAINISYP